MQLPDTDETISRHIVIMIRWKNPHKWLQLFDKPHGE